MAPEADLPEYRARRDFAATPEPAPGEGAAPDPGLPRFVVQRHQARALHFDLRLEHEGALASWAVPKGPPLREGVKRLAVRTEDHPLEYLDFSAVIPEGQYGAGRMTIWDRGVYEPELVAEDEWKLVLEGSILRGHYHLVRTRGRSGKEEWLIFRSGKGPAGPPDPAARFPSLRPMLASTAEAAFDDPAFAFELKWDGYRALALVTSDATELRSRTGRDLTPAYPDLHDLRRALLCQEAVLDGEVVVLDDEGKPDFNALQNGRGPFTYVAFDLLHVDGEWICDRPWSERRERLAAVVSPDAPPRLMLSDHVVGQGGDLFAAAKAQGLEGVIAKRMDAPYRPGRRVAEWRKVKSRPELEAVVGGFTEGNGSHRGSLGALLVGEYDDEGRLRYRSHVGSGFSHALARDLWDRLRAAEVPESPFADPVPKAPAAPHWVRPELKVEVSYAERTPDGRLRAPVFGGLVDDDEGAADLPPGPFGGATGDRAVQEGDRRVVLTNLDKLYWPREGIAKGHLLDHYLRMAPVLVPHLEGRPMILKRYPNGIEEAVLLPAQRGGRPGVAPPRAAVTQRPVRREDQPLRRDRRSDGAAVAGQPRAASTSTPGRAAPTRPTRPPTCCSTSTRPTGSTSTASSRRRCWCARRSRRPAFADTRAPREPAGCTSWSPSPPGPASRRCACSPGSCRRRWCARTRAWSPRSRRSAIAGRGSTSTTTRTGAGAASPASTR